ncbi:MAG: PAS domain S-box protein [Gammaproteobacteria bacterium]|nr:PAS domain S-box protein [Gammaproteobacteria bacterium]
MLGKKNFLLLGVTVLVLGLWPGSQVNGVAESVNVWGDSGLSSTGINGKTLQGQESGYSTVLTEPEGHITFSQAMRTKGVLFFLGLTVVLIFGVAIGHLAGLHDKLNRYEHRLGKEEEGKNTDSFELLRLQNMLDWLPSECWLFDAKSYNCLQANILAREGALVEDDVSVMSLPDLLVDLDRDAFDVLIGAIRSGEQSHVVFRARRQRADGSNYPAEVRLQWLDQGPSPAILAVMFDTTESERLGFALHREKECNRLALETVAEALIITDVQGRIEYLNPVAESLLGLVAIDVLGRAIAKTVKLKQGNIGGPCDPVSTCIVSNAPQTLAEDTEIENSHGARYRTHGLVIPRLDPDGIVDGAVMVMRDIEEIKAPRVASFPNDKYDRAAG